jgi:hypothetical protein
MSDEAQPLLFTFWVRNDVTGESAQFKGQGTTIPEAWKDGWENANADFRPTSSGGPPIAKAHFSVKLPSGEIVSRRPEKFASAEPYSHIEAEEFAAPIPDGDAALPYAARVELRQAQWVPPRAKNKTAKTP